MTPKRKIKRGAWRIAEAFQFIEDFHFTTKLPLQICLNQIEALQEQPKLYNDLIRDVIITPLHDESYRFTLNLTQRRTGLRNNPVQIQGNIYEEHGETVIRGESRLNLLYGLFFSLIPLGIVAFASGFNPAIVLIFAGFIITMMAYRMSAGNQRTEMINLLYDALDHERYADTSRLEEPQSDDNTMINPNKERVEQQRL